MTELTTGQTVKQSVRTMGLNLGDRFKIASAKTKGAGSKEIDVAILKSTTARFHVVPKEKHVANLKFYISGSRSSSNYIAGGLLKRLHSTTDWLTTLKSLVTIHRLIRETDSAAFMEELLRVGEPSARGRGGRVLSIDNFLDMTNIEGKFDFSEWVRAYGKYLDEQLEVFSAIAWHVDLEKSGEASRLKGLSTKDLLQQLPYLQRLQRRLVDCVPRGQAMRDDVVLLSLSMVVRESFRLYKALSEGIINLADKFFTMDYLDALKALEFYKEAISSTEALSSYFTALNMIDAVKRAIEFPALEPPPSDFVVSMEEYLKTAPRPATTGNNGSAVTPRGGDVVDGNQPGSNNGGGSGSGSNEQRGASEGDVPRRTVPLRKGRFSQLHQQSYASPHTSLVDAASKLKDPGMLLPPGALAAAEDDDDDSISDNQPKEGGDGGIGDMKDEIGETVAAVEGDPTIVQQDTGIGNLLDFGDDVGDSSAWEQQSNTGGTVPLTATTEQHQQEPSALDLLTQLDFTALSVSSSPQAPTNTVPSPSGAPSSAGASAIHDTLVFRAAADVYGQPKSAAPPPGHGVVGYNGMTTVQQQQHHIVPYGLTATIATISNSHNRNSPCAAGMQMPSPQQYYGMISPSRGYQQGIVSTSLQQQHQAPWSASPPSVGAARDAAWNVKEAGANDPFSSLAGLPQK